MTRSALTNPDLQSPPKPTVIPGNEWRDREYRPPGLELTRPEGDDTEDPDEEE
jgi:hypothetical protein